MELSREQKRDILTAHQKGKLSLDQEVLKLVSEGFDVTKVQGIVDKVINDHKQKIFEAKLDDEKKAEAKNVANFVIMIVPMLVGLISPESSVLFMIAALVCGIAGYIGYQDKPFAGVLGAITFSGIVPFAINIYLSGRESFINLELLIPVFISAIPALLVYWLISSVFYNN